MIIETSTTIAHSYINATLAFNTQASVFEPAFYHGAKHNPSWEEAIQKELTALIDNGA